MELTMKKGLKIFLAVLMTAAVIAVSSVSAFAAQETLINDKVKAKNGDTVTYTLKLGDCKEKLEGIQMYVFFDKKFLKVQPSSVVFPSLDGVVKNIAYKDGIAFNWTSATSPVDFSKTKTLMTVDFKVQSPGKTDITYFITEMYSGGQDMPNLKSYTLTSDISLNGKKVIKNKPPKLSTDSSLNNQYQGSFINYSDGKGEENGKGDNHIQVTGVTTTPVLRAASEPVDVTKGGGTPISTILVILGIVAAVIAIVIVVILRSHFSKKQDDTADKTE